MSIMKQCNKCNTTKPETEFGTRKDSRDGLNYMCKLCCRAMGKKVYWKDLVATRAKQKARRAKPAILKQRAEYAKVRWSRTTEEQRETKRVSCRLWNSRNKDKTSVYRHRRRHRKTMAELSYTASDRRCTFLAFSNMCANCGSQDKLAVDHHYPLQMGVGLYPGNAGLLCLKCNSSKGTRLPEDFYDADKLRVVEHILARVAAVGPM